MSAGDELFKQANLHIYDKLSEILGCKGKVEAMEKFKSSFETNEDVIKELRALYTVSKNALVNWSRKYCLEKWSRSSCTFYLKCFVESPPPACFRGAIACRACELGPERVSRDAAASAGSSAANQKKC